MFARSVRVDGSVYQICGIKTTSILSINGLTANATILSKDDILKSFVKFGIDEMSLIDAMDNIKLRDFGIVPE